jgi:hypothetical protein
MIAVGHLSYTVAAVFIRLYKEYHASHLYAIAGKRRLLLDLPYSYLYLVVAFRKSLLS